MRNSSAKTYPKTRKNARKALPRTTASAADPPKMGAGFCHWPPKCRTFVIFGRFWHTSKIIKNRIPQNTAKNLKSRTPDRPNGDFGMTFGVHLGIDFHEILDFFHNLRKPPKCLYTKHFGGFSTFRNSHFLTKI